MYNLTLISGYIKVLLPRLPCQLQYAVNPEGHIADIELYVQCIFTQLDLLQNWVQEQQQLYEKAAERAAQAAGQAATAAGEALSGWLSCCRACPPVCRRLWSLHCLGMQECVLINMLHAMS